MELKPKEKAEQLYRDFYGKTMISRVEGYGKKRIALNSALLCVETLQAELIQLNSNKSLELFNYYQDVNKELNKL